MRFNYWVWILLLSLITINIFFGSAPIDWSALFTLKNPEGDWMRWVVINDRIPRTIIAFLSGANLALSGLLLQTVFKNPLAGPTTLGINSGASLGVAFFIFVGGIFGYNFPYYSLILFAFIGAMLFLGILLIFNQRFKSVTTLLIIGLMLGYVSFALVEVMIKFSNSDAIKSFVFWGMGSFDKSNWTTVILFLTSSLVLWLLMHKKKAVYNLMLLGDDELKLSGYSPEKERKQTFLFIGCVVALVTAFVGPLAFIGVAIPNAIKMISRKSNHNFLFNQSILWGGMLTLLTDFLTRGVLFNIVLPVNAVLSILSLPIIFIFLFKKVGFKK